VFKRS